MMCVLKMTSCIRQDVPDLDYDDVFQETCLAAILNSDIELDCDMSLAITRDVKDVFGSRRWRDVLPSGQRYRRYVVTPSEPESPENDYINNIAIGQFLETLPRHGREIVELYYMDGLTQAEIAKRLTIGRSMVSKHLTTMMAGM